MKQSGQPLVTSSPDAWAFYSAFKARKAELEHCPKCSGKGGHADKCAYANWEKQMDRRIDNMPPTYLE